jgi:hypothetical protein
VVSLLATAKTINVAANAAPTNQHAPIEFAPRRPRQHQDRQRRHHRAEARDLPSGQRAELDGRPAGREQHRRQEHEDARTHPSVSLQSISR